MVRMMMSALALFAVVAPAAAEEVQVRRIEVHYGDLDLGSNEGAKQLMLRLQVAARRACAGPTNIQSLSDRRATLQCAGEALAKAVADVDAPVLTALYEAKKGRAPVQLAARDE